MWALIPMTGVLIKKKRFRDTEIHTKGRQSGEDRGGCDWSDTLQPRNAKDCGKPSDARKRQGRIPP